MLKFLTKYSDDRPHPHNSSGDPLLVEYLEEVDKNGVTKLKKIGVRNLDEEIQKNSVGTDINELVAKFKLSGDSTIFNQLDEGTYLDTTMFPKTMSEMINRVRSAESEFESLPIDLRQMFNNSVDEWLCSYGSDEFLNKYNKFAERFETQNIVHDHKQVRLDDVLKKGDSKVNE